MSYRGPVNPDDFRIEYKRSRHYFDPLPADELRPEGPMTDEKGEPIRKLLLPAQSTITKAIAGDALLYWAVGKTAEYAVDEREKWERLDRDDAIDVLKKAHKKASSKAASRGSDIHAYIDARVLGRPFDLGWLNDDAKPYVAIIDRFFDDQEPELILSEVVGIGEGHGVTTDAILRLPKLSAGLRVVDWKTRNDTVKEPHVVYEKEAVQIGANTDLRYLIVEDVETGKPTRIPVPDYEFGTLVTFTTTSYAIHEIDTAKAVEMFRELYSWWKASRIKAAAKKATVVELPKAEPESTVVETVTVVAEHVDGPVEVTLPKTVVDRAELRRRIEKIQSLPDLAVLADLMARWPLSVGLSDAPDSDLPAIVRAVELTEAKFELPFDPPPSEPLPPRESVAAPAPEPKPDEGPEVGEEDVETVRKAWLLLEDAGAAWIEKLAAGARNLSMTEKPSARRARIGFALVRLAVGGWGEDELLEVVLEHSNALRHRGDVVRSLAALDWHDAGRLSTTVGEVVEGRLNLTVESDGETLRLSAA